MATITLRIDDTEKKELDQALDAIGMNVSAFYAIYTKKFLHEKRIPFEISVPDDPFYSQKNMKQIEKSNQQIKDGQVIIKTIDELKEMEDA